MRISGDWIRAAGLQQVMGCLSAGGHRAYLVGGCVRNALMGHAVSDLDLATDALPERVMQLAVAAGLRAVPTGIEHGTVTVVAEGVAHEITTFRRDVETDGRHAVVAYSTLIEEDAARRDFTMNALYADADGQVIDPLGGLPDLQARRVRFVGTPEARIREDYLRILRFFRFHACYGAAEQGLDADGLAACAANLDGLSGLSRERVGHEMRKLLGAPDPAPALTAMRACGALGQILPGADLRALAPLVHLDAAVEPDPIRRLAAIGAADATQRLRLSKDEARRLQTLTQTIGSTERPGELAYRHGANLARDTVLLRAALLEMPLPPDAETAIARGAAAKFPVRAADLPGLSGRDLGQRLKALEERWIASDFGLSRAQLLA